MSAPEEPRIERPRFALTTLSREELIERVQRAEASEVTLQRCLGYACRELERLSEVAIGAHGTTWVNRMKRR